MCFIVEDQTFGDKLKSARERHNLTRVQLAEQIGSSPKTIARWERGETLPRSQFHQKLCAILNTTPQELGLETKTVGEKQRHSPIHQPGSSPTFFAPSLHKLEKRPFTLIQLHTDTEENNRKIDAILGMSLKYFLLQCIATRTGAGKPSSFNSIFGNDAHKRNFGATSAKKSTNGWKYPALNMLSPENIEKKALCGFFRGGVISLAYANKEKYISYIAEHPITISQYTLLSTFCGIVLPTISTIHLQIDIGEIVTSIMNAMQIIHYVLSDPAWQGFGVVISIIVPIIMEYKKKSFPVAPFSVSLALAA